MGKCASTPIMLDPAEDEDDSRSRSVADLLETSIRSQPVTSRVCQMLPQSIARGEIWRRYKKLGRPFSQGVSCQVWRVMRRADGALFAMKRMPRTKGASVLMRREMGVLAELREHPNLVTLDCVLVDKNHYYVLTHLCTGGQVFARLREQRQFDEARAARVVARILGTVRHLHEHGIVHRDLKLENLVYEHEGEEAEVVIIDFGDARRVRQLQVFNDLRGTVPYIAPEQFRARRGWEMIKSDVWSIGVIVYLLLVGRYPFHGPTREHVVTAILEEDIRPSMAEAGLSAVAQDFILSLLDRDVRRRPTCAQALRHPWVRAEAAKFAHHVGDAVLRSLAAVEPGNALQEAVVGHLARHMSVADASVLDEAFDVLDGNRDGVVDAGDVRQFYNRQTIDEDAAVPGPCHLVAGLDRDAFRCAKKAAALRQGSVLVRQFHWLDINGDGFISVQDLKLALSTEQSTQELVDMVHAADADGDGQIGPCDFAKALRLESLVP